MSQENVEIVWRWIELFNRRDTAGLIELTEPDFEMKSLLVATESDFRGEADFPHRYFEQIDDAYEHLQSVPDGVRDGKVYREETFMDRAEAFKAAGLSE